MKKYIIIILIAAGFAGCSKVTDQSPISSISLNNAFKTAQDANAGVIACYDGLQDLTKFLFYWGEGRTDVFALTVYSNTGDQQITGGNVDALNLNGFGSWGTAYSVINRANEVIKFVPAITDPAITNSRQRLIAEAHYVRALTYFYLRRVFVNVPLITEPNTDVSQNLFVSQAHPDSVTAQIERDLNFAEATLTDAPYTTLIENKGRATKGAVYALQADFYLWKHNYALAATKAAAVETSSQAYTLVPGAQYINIFREKNTAESIFEIQYNQQDAGNNLYNDFLPQSATAPVYPGGGWSVQPSQKMKDSIAVNDLRRTAVYKIVLPGVTNDPPFRNDLNKPYVNKHFGNVVGTTRTGDNNYIVYRLADIILLRAEALNEGGKTPEAITQVNRIIARAGLTAIPANSGQEFVRTQIAKQRFVELAYEGKRYFDLVRRGTYATETGNTLPRYLYWPIELAELQRNPNLVQNQDY